MGIQGTGFKSGTGKDSRAVQKYLGAYFPLAFLPGMALQKCLRPTKNEPKLFQLDHFPPGTATVHPRAGD